MGFYLKFVALPVPEIDRRYSKNLGSVPGCAHVPFSHKFFMGFCSDGPCECTCQIWNSYSFTGSWDNSDWSFTLGL